MREIILPPHLYDRIKASAGEHGGIGRNIIFNSNPGDAFCDAHGEPHCAHGHAWGTASRYYAAKGGRTHAIEEPTLSAFITFSDNDSALIADGVKCGDRIPFARWCELLNVKRGVEVPAQEPELVSVA